MKEKSIRQLAKEIGVSARYLSQVKNGKRPPSEKVLSKAESMLRTSTPLRGVSSVFGGFDSHALPPGSTKNRLQDDATPIFSGCI